MMKAIKLFAILALVLLASASSYAAEVNNVELRYQDGQTQAKIFVDGTIRYTHQTEVAKDGKPFRVIVDIVAATHNLGAKSFKQVPNCVVSDLRTSQYSVTPEKVVRLVFDMKKEIFYQISSSKDYIIVNFPDKESAPFAAWSTADVVRSIKNAAASKPSAPIAKAENESKAMTQDAAAQKSVVELNKSIENDRQSSLASTSSSQPTQSRPKATGPNEEKPMAVTKPAVKPMTSTTPSDKFIGPDVSEVSPQTAEKEAARASGSTNFSDDMNYSPAKPAVESNTPAKSVAPTKSEPAKQDNKTNVVKSESAKSDPQRDTPPAFKSKKSTLAQNSQTEGKSSSAGSSASKSKKTETVDTEKAKAESAKKVAKQSPSKDTSSKSKPAAKAPASKSDSKKEVASKPKEDSPKKTTIANNDDDAIKSTSRFRRSAKDRKIQGTMVAEFPKRLVIKYKSSGHRDPFATLVDETKVSNSPSGQKVPNVEGLKLVGVIEADHGKNQALFEDKQGYGYILKSGDKVQKGYVLRVEATRVYFQIFEYGWSRTVALNLQEN